MCFIAIEIGFKYMLNEIKILEKSKMIQNKCMTLPFDFISFYNLFNIFIFRQNRLRLAFQCVHSMGLLDNAAYTQPFLMDN